MVPSLCEYHTSCVIFWTLWLCLEEVTKGEAKCVELKGGACLTIFEKTKKQISFVSKAFIFYKGDVVQLVDRLLCTQNVVGSNPIVSIFWLCLEEVTKGEALP